MIILLNFVFEISKYVFSRRGNTNFPLGTPSQSLRHPPSSGAYSMVYVPGTDISILYYLPVKCIKPNLICPPKYTSGCRI